MSPQVLRRFIIIGAIATFVMFSFWAVLKQYAGAPPGDYEVRQGDILLTDKKYDEAVERFDEALKKSPNHRGALIGRAIALMQSGRYEEAEAEFTYLIGFLTENLQSDDRTGFGTLASAYANRGILYDRNGRYEKALADYTQAMKVDEGAVEGPDIIHKILYGNSRPATVRQRAEYLQEQLALPESERRLRFLELDEKQRMYKP